MTVSIQVMSQSSLKCHDEDVGRTMKMIVIITGRCRDMLQIVGTRGNSVRMNECVIRIRIFLLGILSGIPETFWNAYVILTNLLL